MAAGPVHDILLAGVLSESKASKPTVISALEHLRKLDVIAGQFGDFVLQPPSWDAWQSLALDLK